MAIQYCITENNLQKGTYYLRTVPKGTTSTRELATQISEKSLVHPTDVSAVLDILGQEVGQELARGNTVHLDDFLGVSLSLRLKKDVKIDSPHYSLRREDISIHINLRSKKQLQDHVFQLLKHPGQLERVEMSSQAPQITTVYDLATSTANQLRSGHNAVAEGQHLSFDDSDPSQGLFVEAADHTQTPVEEYVSASANKIVFLLPPGLSAGACQLLFSGGQGDVEQDITLV